MPAGRSQRESFHEQRPHLGDRPDTSRGLFCDTGMQASGAFPKLHSTKAQVGIGGQESPRILRHLGVCLVRGEGSLGDREGDDASPRVTLSMSQQPSALWPAEGSLPVNIHIPHRQPLPTSPRAAYLHGAAQHGVFLHVLGLQELWGQDHLSARLLKRAPGTTAQGAAPVPRSRAPAQPWGSLE